MAEFNHGIGLRELTDKYLSKPQSNRGFAPSVYVDSLILMLEGGGRSLEDIRELANERGLTKLIGRGVIPSSDAIGDWLRKMGDPSRTDNGIAGLDKVSTEINHRILKHDPREKYTLDADATEIIAEKIAAAFTYKGNQGFMPMLGFLFEPTVCLHAEWREGNEAPGSGQVRFYRGCKERMPSGKQIGWYRADSASYNAGLINELEADGVVWAITADQDSAVKAAIREIEEQGWTEPVAGCGYEVAETVHSMNKTNKAFRLAIKREKREQGDLFENGGEHYFYHAIATNWEIEMKDTHHVIEWHNQRGQAENFNKELKHGIGMDRMPCGQSKANAVFFQIGVLAYNLFVGFKRLSCPQGWVQHTIATLRWKLVQVAGHIVRHAGAVILKLAADAEKLELFNGIRKRTYEMSLCIDVTG